ncbi:hypothetical protein McanMca71_007641 [Microsporum canis]|uniref:Uncharacterized protein n=1 Tax=Arthroderma otae (strain ATCC MYA-4605 / CBS 113480) TaxID=554155 RepID=C5FYQ9_ARTOC|nr:uncharacterized protein MCYG_07476 [Microsporum canis CBS 113480]EEQ34657.1 predicted protein [Microsporum canis CBS 113480]
MPLISDWRLLRRHRSHRGYRHNIANSRIYGLPSELLDIIYQYLESEDDAIALGFAGARFFYSDTLKSVLSSKEARYKGLCMLEDSGEIGRHCCSGCLVIHPSSAAFSLQELEKRPTERHCLVTNPCLKLSLFPDLSFADIEMALLKQAKERRQRNWFTRLYSSPEVMIEVRLRLFPREAVMDFLGFTKLCELLDRPLCTHLRERDIGIPILYMSQTGPKPRKPTKPIHEHKDCFDCKTRVTMELLPAHTHGNNGEEWYALNVTRSLGRLYSPLEPTWLKQTFGFKHPKLEDYLRVTEDWFRAYWVPSPNPRRDSLVPLSGIDHLGYWPPFLAGGYVFKPAILPTNLSTRIARFGVKVWLFASGLVPERIHREYGQPYTLTLTHPEGLTVSKEAWEMSG